MQIILRLTTIVTEIVTLVLAMVIDEIGANRAHITSNQFIQFLKSLP